MRVAYFTDFWPSPSETWVHHEVRGLERLGCEVRVFSMQPRLDPSTSREWPALMQRASYMAELPCLGALSGLWHLLRPRVMLPFLKGFLTDVPTMRLRVQITRDLLRCARLWPAIRAFDPELSVCHFAGSRTNLGLYYGLATGTPFVIKTHSADVFERPALLRLKLERAAVVYTISRYNIEWLREKEPDVRIEGLSIQGCGIDLDEFAFTPAAGDEKPPVLLAVARIEPTKGYDVLMRACARLLARGFDHRLVVIGDGSLRGQVEATIRELGIGDHVEMLGYVPPETVRERLGQATAWVLPCVWDPVGRTQDGLPVSLIEALATGVPVVSSSISAIPELVEDGVTGFLAEPGDVEGLADAIERACTMTPEARRALLERARAAVEARHDAAKLAGELLADVRRAVPALR